MRNRLGWALMLLCLAAVSGGCSPLSLNMQKSGLRAVGDVSTTWLIEHREGVTAAGVLAAADKLIAYLESGDVSNLPLGDLEDKLKAQVPEQYAALVSKVVKAASKRLATATGKIGKNNVARMLALAKGIRMAGAEYTDAACRHHLPYRDWERHGVGVYAAIIPHKALPGGMMLAALK